MSRDDAWLWRQPLAHRGLHDRDAGVPENSLVAFERAAEAGIPVEFDVRLDADGVPVVVHDDDLERLTGEPGRVADLRSAELQRRRLAGTDHPIPTLRDVLDCLAGRVGAMVEIKNPSHRAGPVEEATWGLLRDYDGPFCVASFNPRTVRWFRTNAPAVIRGQTAGPLRDAEGLPGWLRPLLAVMAGNAFTAPDFLSYDLRGLPSRAVDFWRRRGLAVITWTVTTPDDVVKARAVADNFIYEGVEP
ncbi:MAG: glycerophosphodiester phosphodiesterase family protein [Nitriliruptorales bacterium]|nr:glycerophosphodiester phosphodiesterase family protein [Nitriliruptorales bacterium]